MAEIADQSVSARAAVILGEPDAVTVKVLFDRFRLCDASQARLEGDLRRPGARRRLGDHHLGAGEESASGQRRRMGTEPKGSRKRGRGAQIA